MTRIVMFAVVAVELTAAAARAHPGHDHAAESGLRVWHLFGDDGEAFAAAFVAVRGEELRLRMENGTVAPFPLWMLSPGDRAWVREKVEAIRGLNTAPAVFVVHQADPAPPIEKHFEPFRKTLQLRWDADFLYVGSNGLPDHPMMVGIRAWQQQVPLPQPYTGANAWRIPLRPKFADKPVSAKTNLYRGAIALAVNGVPIFNPLNNRGEDASLAGELDEYGGHCGRADDYHYHTAPVHLEKVAGKGNPIGYGLDGYPLYGFADADGNEPKDLDEFNGRTEKDGGYRYYSTRKYPYVMGGMRGVVAVRGDQVEPQPRAAPVRPAGEPLRGAKVTAFEQDAATGMATLKYDVRGRTHAVQYTANKDGTYTFVFVDGAGRETTETYRRREGPPKKKKP
jgi:hypothetical protein